MRDYQRKGKYILPQAVYNKTVWQIRDYQRMKDTYEALAEERPAPPDGMPRGSGGKSDPTAQKAIKLSELSREIDAIEKARKMMPAEYRDGVWMNVQYRIPFPDDAARGTYGRWKSRFIYAVAISLGYIQ